MNTTDTVHEAEGYDYNRDAIGFAEQVNAEIDRLHRQYGLGKYEGQAPVRVERPPLTDEEYEAEIEHHRVMVMQDYRIELEYSREQVELYTRLIAEGEADPSTLDD